jgi:hypothetical protein
MDGDGAEPTGHCRVTLATAAGITDRLFDASGLVTLLEELESKNYLRP